MRLSLKYGETIRIDVARMPFEIENVAEATALIRFGNGPQVRLNAIYDAYIRIIQEQHRQKEEKLKNDRPE